MALSETKGVTYSCSLVSYRNDKRPDMTLNDNTGNKVKFLDGFSASLRSEKLPLRCVPNAQLLFPFDHIATVTLRLDAKGQWVLLQLSVRRPVEARRCVYQF